MEEGPCGGRTLWRKDLVEERQGPCGGASSFAEQVGDLAEQVGDLAEQVGDLAD